MFLIFLIFSTFLICRLLTFLSYLITHLILINQRLSLATYYPIHQSLSSQVILYIIVTDHAVARSWLLEKTWHRISHLEIPYYSQQRLLYIATPGYTASYQPMEYKYWNTQYDELQALIFLLFARWKSFVGYLDKIDRWI